mmetsp:Transcript_30612/g.49546  ORF Transcript_30612/g.49546 Transcript_30612/m.49546 type:complete len:249 (-) Transcript_30612:396-1142(-)|eukprot:CAMPEP_0184675280 /NCGR_PEP_ID=MMETSP0308-20130426/87704_1 /TAXON_ID=38269 /ORGANISM="Gloeochaete witrockiana, Strain SAG 46.84" /LENGTH=248 /DNA_ID=CAMNT_0027122971 /DNA_START=472 /DNA_END=1218 /DNA_ORIENTATION=-
MPTLAVAGPSGPAKDALVKRLCLELRAQRINLEHFVHPSTGRADLEQIRTVLKQLQDAESDGLSSDASWSPRAPSPQSVWHVVDGAVLLRNRSLWDAVDRVVLLNVVEEQDILPILMDKWNDRYRWHNVPLKFMVEKWNMFWHAARDDTIIVDCNVPLDEMLEIVLAQLRPSGMEVVMTDDEEEEEEEDKSPMEEGEGEWLVDDDSIVGDEESSRQKRIRSDSELSVRSGSTDSIQNFAAVDSQSAYL